MPQVYFDTDDFKGHEVKAIEPEKLERWWFLENLSKMTELTTDEQFAIFMNTSPMVGK
jgi:hypothetical protein